jgi:hypothetical protein
MKATKAGAIIGTAMAGYDSDGVGTVTLFVKNGVSNGTDDYSQQVLLTLLSGNVIIPTNSVDLSEITTDQVTAGITVITPKLTAKDVNLNGAMSLVDSSGIENVRIDSQGNAFFAGTVTADAIDVRQIKGVFPEVALLGSVSSGDLSTFVTDIQKENPADPVKIITDKIIGGDNFLTDLIVARITAIRGYFDEIFANKVHTNDLCLKKSDGTEVCMNGDQMDNLLPPATPIPTSSASPAEVPVIFPNPTPSVTPTPTATETPTPSESPSATPEI